MRKSYRIFFAEKKPKKILQINFYDSIFVVQKVPQATRVARGEKEIRCESETVPAAVSSILDRPHARSS